MINKSENSAKCVILPIKNNFRLFLKRKSEILLYIDRFVCYRLNDMKMFVEIIIYFFHIYLDIYCVIHLIEYEPQMNW